LLTREPVRDPARPQLSDVHFMGQILQDLGASVSFVDGSVRIHAATLKGRATTS